MPRVGRGGSSKKAGGKKTGEKGRPGLDMEEEEEIGGKRRSTRTPKPLKKGERFGDYAPEDDSASSDGGQEEEDTRAKKKGGRAPPAKKAKKTVSGGGTMRSTGRGNVGKKKRKMEETDDDEEEEDDEEVAPKAKKSKGSGSRGAGKGSKKKKPDSESDFDEELGEEEEESEDEDYGPHLDFEDSEEEPADWEEPDYDDEEWFKKNCLSCQKCDKLFKDPGSALKCFNKHNKLRCYLCFVVLKRGRNGTKRLFKHYRDRHEVGDKQYSVKCPHCSESLSYRHVSCHVVDIHLREALGLSGGGKFSSDEESEVNESWDESDCSYSSLY